MFTCQVASLKPLGGLKVNRRRAVECFKSEPELNWEATGPEGKVRHYGCIPRSPSYLSPSHLWVSGSRRGRVVSFDRVAGW